MSLKFNKVLIACDHAGFDLKQIIVKNISQHYSGLEVADLGCYNGDQSQDYPDFAQKLCSQIDESDKIAGILICGSGIGMSIAANRFAHIRAALCYDISAAQLSRNHNNANILCLGARFTDDNLACQIVSKFLEESFLKGRHLNRIRKITQDVTN